MEALIIREFQTFKIENNCEGNNLKFKLAD